MIEKIEKEKELEIPDRKDSWKMFNRIAHRYDLLNRLLSFGRDKKWRKKLTSLIPSKKNLSIIDLASGTGDVILAVNDTHPNLHMALGVDMSDGMLAYGQDKISKRKLNDQLMLIRGDGMNLPVLDSSFDISTIAFGIRNMVEVDKALKEMYRALKPGGRALILEFSLPENKIIRNLYLFYFRFILPVIGSVISGDDVAYRYLNKTVESFPYGDEFCRMMEKAGFDKTEQHMLTFGIATIYVGEKKLVK